MLLGKLSGGGWDGALGPVRPKYLVKASLVGVVSASAAPLRGSASPSSEPRAPANPGAALRPTDASARGHSWQNTKYDTPTRCWNQSVCRHPFYHSSMSPCWLASHWAVPCHISVGFFWLAWFFCVGIFFSCLNFFHSPFETSSHISCQSRRPGFPSIMHCDFLIAIAFGIVCFP